MGFHIKLEGMEELQKQLEKAQKMEEAKKVVQYHGANLQRKMQRKAPVDTGALKRSIFMDTQDGGLTASVGATMDYAPYLEFGTRKMTAQPFARPSLEEEGKSFRKDLEKLVE